jgi:hypothetical protein
MPRREVQPGEAGRAAGPLRPGGHIVIAGWRYEARTDGEFLGPDTPVLVVRREAFCLVVRALREGDAPLTVTEERDRQGACAHESRRQRHRARRSRLTLFAAAIMAGVACAAFVVSWVQTREGGLVLDGRWPAALLWGALAGASYLTFLQVFLSSAHEIVSENIAPRPNLWMAAVVPVMAALPGAVGGYRYHGSDGAAWGALACAFILPPVLCLLYHLLLTLLEVEAPPPGTP